MKTIKLYRHWQDENQTFGTMVVFDEKNLPIFSSMTIERGWLNNKRNVSCVPEGSYCMELEYSPRFKQKLWELKGVPNRSECKIHSANSWHQLNGCIALGVKLKDIDKDGYIDVTYSKLTISSFHVAMGSDVECEIIIKNSF